MCNPVALALASGVVGAAGSVYSGMTAAQSYDDQAAFADRQAVLERQSGAYERDRLRTHGDRALAGMRQQYLSSGIALEGSAREVIEDSAREAALDEEAVLFGAKLKSDNRRFEAKLARSNAQSAMIGGLLGGASSLIGGFNKAAGFRRTKLDNAYSTYGTGEP